MKNCCIKTSNIRHTAVGLFLTLLAIVFITQFFTNAAANFFKLPTLQESLLDACLLLIISYPALYILIFKPLSAEIACRERAEKMKDEFIGTVSHELRTPLSITKEGLCLVLDKIPGPINEQQARILTISKSNIDRLTRIINSLLDISKIEAGKLDFKREAFDIISVTRQVITMFETKAGEKGLELRDNLPKSAMIVHGDSDAITQLLMNLIGNALKFTKQGHIEITAKDATNSFEFAISDTGIGISKEDMPKLFDKFQQFGRVNGPGEKGTGLGLAIAKGIITAHNGKIWVESEPGKGTKIIFTLPKKIS